MTNIKDALEFYADPKNWKANSILDMESIFFDGWTKAQQALSQLTASPDREKVAAEPTLAQINSACLSYRHDYGLLLPDHRARVRFEAREWLRAWQKEGFATIAPDEAAIRAAAFEEAAKIVTSRVEGMELQRFVFNGVTSTDTRGNDLFIAKSDVEKLLNDRAAAIRSQEAGR